MKKDSDNWEKVESDTNDFGWKKMGWSWNNRGPSIGLPLLILVVGI